MQEGTPANPHGGRRMKILHIAQVNRGRMKAALEDPVRAGFVARLDEINALADTRPGFVWRLQTSGGNATYLRPYDDDRILFNMSVWESTAHVAVFRNRQAWFEKFAGAYAALWWVPPGPTP